MDREKEILGASEQTDEIKATSISGDVDTNNAKETTPETEKTEDSENVKSKDSEDIKASISESVEDNKNSDPQFDLSEKKVASELSQTDEVDETSKATETTVTASSKEKAPEDPEAESLTSKEETQEEKIPTEVKKESLANSATSTETDAIAEDNHSKNDGDGEEEDEDDHHHDEDAKIDYNNYDKQQLVVVVEGLLKENDFRKIDKVLKEVKPHYDELRESERAEALKRFIETGGDAADFVMKNDPTDVKFDADFSLLKERKAKYYSSLEKQKEDNLTAKNNLLERLRNLADDEETTVSITALKEIQKEWKSIGQIPASQVKSLWANYNALIDRFYDNRSIYFELKELDRRKNLELKLEICERAEKLAEESNLKKAIKDLNDLHEEFRHIGPVPKDDQEALWQRFKAASDVLYDKRREFIDKLKVDLNENLKIKQALGDEAQVFLTFDSERINEWNDKTKEVLELQKRWEAAGGLPREKAKEINKHFWGAFKGFFSNKNAFFKRLEGQREENLKKKEELVAKAEELKESKDFDKTAETLKALQNEWREIGPVPEKQKNSVFIKFKKACDYFFDQKRAKNKEVNKEFDENLKKKEEICSAIEQMTADKTFDIDKLETLFDQYQAIGFVPKNAIRTIQNRFNTSVDNFLDAAENLSEEEKHNIKLTIKFTKLKNSPNSNRKLYHKEGEIRKHIAQIENDIALWRNNLEFFANSKTADKLKEDFNKKIKHANEELKELQEQLHVLRNI